MLECATLSRLYTVSLSVLPSVGCIQSVLPLVGCIQWSAPGQSCLSKADSPVLCIWAWSNSSAATQCRHPGVTQRQCRYTGVTQRQSRVTQRQLKELKEVLDQSESSAPAGIGCTVQKSKRADTLISYLSHTHTHTHIAVRKHESSLGNCKIVCKYIIVNRVGAKSQHSAQSQLGYIPISQI